MITELDGLAKGQDNFGGGSGGRSTGSRGNYNVSATHVRAVQEKARMAVAFLERGFEAREPCLRALTSRGNQLESISFRSEDTSGQQVRCFFIISFLFFCWYAVIPIRSNVSTLFLVTLCSILSQGNNDDVILSCCLHYCKDKAKDFMPDQRSA